MSSPVTNERPADGFIRTKVRGKSFADVGGLWGTGQGDFGERVTLAYGNGATSMAMIDAHPGWNLWQPFKERCAANGLTLSFRPETDSAATTVRGIIRDIHDFADLEMGAADKYDFVHCSGVIYHSPNPMRVLTGLRAVTREYLALSSAVTPTRIETALGTIQLPDAACVFLPALANREQEIFRSYWINLIGDGATGLTSPTDLGEWFVNNYGTWWWLYTAKALRAMSTAAGFEIIDEALSVQGHVYSLLLKYRPYSPEAQTWVVKARPEPV